MRKLLMLFLVIGLIGGGTFQQAHAQDIGVGINFNIGFLSKYLPWFRLVTFGAEADFHLGKYVMVSPELKVWTYTDSKSKSYYINPGATLNLKLGPFFLGGGAIKRNFVTSYGDTLPDKFRPKFNIGFRTKNFKLTIYAIPISYEGHLNFVYVGTSIGLGINLF